jgi:hypothetical protein
LVSVETQSRIEFFPGGDAAADHGGGTIWIVGGEIIAHVPDSPGIHSTGYQRAGNASLLATNQAASEQRLAT